ncbi:MAG: cation transporter [Eubacteriales bacterium]|jgi:copper chaperone
MADQQTVSLKVSGMSCMHCRAAVQDALAGVAGVKSAEVNLDQGKATVTFDPEVATVDKMREAIKQSGFEVV